MYSTDDTLISDELIRLRNRVVDRLPAEKRFDPETMVRVVNRTLRILETMGVKAAYHTLIDRLVSRSPCMYSQADINMCACLGAVIKCLKIAAKDVGIELRN